MTTTRKPHQYRIPITARALQDLRAGQGIIIIAHAGPPAHLTITVSPAARRITTTDYQPRHCLLLIAPEPEAHT